ncbi:alpha/beta hydrolase-fold protein [Corynebacterium sp. NPDC060344]|uniref:alpha/beta hydrolase-fold protein n=1 Tax=Corynebacterium sp. NPDC060344 TaxID=3347101 RepID=UPI0036500E16
MSRTSNPPPAHVGGPTSTPAFFPPLPGRPQPVRALRILGGTCGPEELFRQLDAAGGCFIDDEPTAGTCTVTVAKQASGPGERAALMIDALTHMHRRDLRPFLLERVTAGGCDVHVGAFIVPRDLRSTAGILARDPWDPRIGHDRASWARAMDGLAPLRRGSRGPDVLELPGAPTHPWTTGAAASPDPAPARRFRSEALGIDVEYRVDLPESDPEVLLLLSDGHRFTSDYPLLPQVRAAEGAGAAAATAVVAFNAMDIPGRMTMLGRHPRFHCFLRDELIPRAEAAAGCRLPRDPGARVIAGASLGGLTGANVVRVAPEVVACAIVQSASFWWPANDPAVPGGVELREWAAHDPAPGVRIFHEVGTMEGHLLESNRRFADIVRGSGAEVVAREFAGGHDYACWRAGVVDGLIALHPRRR